MNSVEMRTEQSIEKKFVSYVSRNIWGMIGISAYILADTFFISMAEGANGITALNLVLPLYSLIFGIGSMIGVGSATRFNILKTRKDKSCDDYFSNALMFAVLLSSVFMVVGAFFPGWLIEVLGGDRQIVAIGTPYTRIFMLFAPFFMANYICNAFVRNDGNPSLAMKATLLSSLFNIVMDYILMFPLGLGMTGAALATVFSPIVGILICCKHFFSKENSVRFLWKKPSVSKLFQSCQLGTAALIGEISSGVTTAIFNFLILSLAGKDGVAAYGIVANTAIVATSIFNGISFGAQPILSESYGKGETQSVKKLLRLAIGCALICSIGILLLTNLGTETIVSFFNSENNPVMENYALTGVRLYFIGFLFAGFNIVGTGYLSATENAGWAFITSLLRGIGAIAFCAFVLAHFFGMTGIWLAFPAAEGITAIVMMIAIRRNGRSAAFR